MSLPATRPKDWYRQTLFIALSFAVLYRYYVYKLKVCGKLKVASLSVPFFQWHLLSLCLFGTSHHFKPSNNKKMMTC